MDLKKNNEIQTYINDVCAQVKNKRVHKEIIAELNAHLEEKANEYLKGGKSENEALKEAINEMGSSKHVGDELNEIHKCNPEWSIIVMSITLVLLSIGVITLFQINGNLYRIFRSSLILDRSILWGTIGLVALVVGCFIDYRKIKIYSKYIYIVGIVLMSCTVFSFFDGFISGHGQVLQIGGFSINTAYFGPIIFIVALAGIYDKYDWNNRNNMIKGLLLGIVPLLLVAMANINILGYFIMYGVSLNLLVYMSKANKKILGLFAAIEILILFLTRVGFESVSGFINRWNDINDSGYVYNQLKIMRDSSVLIGRGVNFDLNTLPEFYNDVIFSSIVYSFGWVAGAIVVILLATLLIRIIKVAISVKNSYGKSLVLGLTNILGIQFVWNILFNLGLAVGGVSLPFISYSGTSIIINMFIVGIVINVYKGRSISKVELIKEFHYKCIILITKK
ncbi:cell division protein FtsW [Clostridium gelidum]|uniref:Cell division protein FtsW n=1 Tax=Clostridium gelidum TaxID=704125 RepID=A0ABM7T5R0_9CLOT|nr:FtsW/RodA/SpoVE family cell cycle protein [Clostridium gelidum]BCZ46282.1 cell division protein FtsW [Clostridium gelidum]